MDTEHVKLLKLGATTWNRWRDENPDIQPDLQHAYLHQADLRGVQLSGLNLQDVFFCEADLENVDLRYADLQNSNLSDTYLAGAQFDNATMGRTTLRNVNLSRVSGLETVQHRHPSEIGMNTILMSGWNVPESFLLAAGIEASRLETARALLAKPYYHTCFISYSHQEMIFAKALYKKLLRKGVDSWLDDRQLAAGEELTPEIARAIEERDKLLLCCSEYSLSSKWVNSEVAFAMNKEERLCKEWSATVTILIPLDLDGYLRTDDWCSPYRTKIQERIALNFTKALADPKEFDNQVDKLLIALWTDTARKWQSQPMPRL